MNTTLYTIDSFKISNYRSFYDEQEIIFNNTVKAFMERMLRVSPTYIKP